MNKLGCLIVMFVSCRVCIGQHLVPNPSFEVYDTCQTFVSLYQMPTVQHAMPWFQPTFGTSDYFNSCANTIPPWYGSVVGVPQNFFGYQIPKNGNAYTGFYTIDPDGFFPNYREYVEVKLNSPLQASTTYYVCFFVSLADSSNYATDDIGAYFSNDTINNDSTFILSYIPQIINPNGFLSNKNVWSEISGSFTALGGEQFITIGNFKNDINTDTMLVAGGFAITGDRTCYYYLDAIYVSSDSTICFGTVGVNEINENKNSIIFPNPFSEKITVTLSDPQVCKIILFDITSRRLLQQVFKNSTSINTQQLAKGIYLYEVRNKNGVIKKGKVVKD